MRRKINATFIKEKNLTSLFELEKNKIIEIPNMPICEFDHIGSTAFSNSYGEEILDILVVVKNLHEITSFDEKRLNNIGYHRVEHGAKGIVKYRKITDFTKMSFSVQLFIIQKNSDIYFDFVNFNNLLKSNNKYLEKYNQFKSDIYSDDLLLKDIRKKRDVFIKKILNEVRK